jgi:hypothetical protein
MEQSHLQLYLSRFEPLKLLPRGPTLTEEEAIRWLIDEAFRASKQMIRTHLKDDIIRFIVLAQVLNSHGYTMQWVKFKGCVGATKSSNQHTSMPKEVTRVDKGINGNGITNGS